MFTFGRANRIVYDYSEKGALKSIEGSLNRLGVDKVMTGAAEQNKAFVTLCAVLDAIG
jgi:hypothetical protein